MQRTNGSEDDRYTRGLARFISQLKFDDIPHDVVHRAKLLILDAIGCGLYAAQKPWGAILSDTFLSLDSTRDCAVWGTDKRLSAPHAAFVNGAMIQGFEIDDIHRQGMVHVGCVTVPVVLALAEARGPMSGRDFLTAVIAGYETTPRVGQCVGQEHLGKGWHPTGTVGTFGAAAAGSAALRLSEEQTVHALGLAGSQAAGIMAVQFGSMMKRGHAGRACQSGIYAATLAQNGFTGITNVFESRFGGFCTAFSQTEDRFDLTELTAGLGTSFETMRYGLKFYSSAASTQTALDAIRNIKARRDFKPDELDRIVVHGGQVMMEHTFWKYEPSGITNAQFNMPFTIATLLLEGDVFIDEFTEESIRDPRRIALSEKVEFVHEPSITAMGPKHRYIAEVEVYLKDGTTLLDRVEAQRGSEQCFASDAQVFEKFEKLARRVLPTAQVSRVRDLVMSAESIGDVTELVKEFQPRG
ncbi:MAG: MmgE/PrpD family protein [Rhizobiales bacterium]|nr:MmgE/PrpD family protein [Hyphomicrobiales bacterium]OJY45840.1 MAG: 2-methylcitrate dehydratase [Rhizobiales bacterium 64-17]